MLNIGRIMDSTNRIDIYFAFGETNIFKKADIGTIIICEIFEIKKL
jgi:hypothetical protein